VLSGSVGRARSLSQNLPIKHRLADGRHLDEHDYHQEQASDSESRSFRSKSISSLRWWPNFSKFYKGRCSKVDDPVTDLHIERKRDCEIKLRAGGAYLERRTKAAQDYMPPISRSRRAYWSWAAPRFNERQVWMFMIGKFFIHSFLSRVWMGSLAPRMQELGRSSACPLVPIV